MPSLNPCLPQNDPNPEQRQHWLQQNRTAYQFDHAFLSPMAFLNTSHLPVPAAERFTLSYWLERIWATLKLPLNQVGARLHAFRDPVDQLQDYEDFFSVLPKPTLVQSYRSDLLFAEQRLSGANPVKLARLTALPANFAFTIQELQAQFGDSLDLIQALAAGDLYIADYSKLSSVEAGQYGDEKQFLPTPIALFCCNRSAPLGSQLVPVAIQLKPKLGKASPLITPFNQPTASWEYAKLCVQTADANHHEMSSHLCRTHFVMEPFAVSTARHLGQNHPLGLLLRPHFRFMLANGHLGRTRLLGYIDRLLTGNLDRSLKMVLEAYQSWSLDQFALPTELANRGVDDPERLPHYPYRDDGLLLWQAIKEFVGEYLGLYYKTQADIEQDTELQAWIAELKAETGGRVRGIEHIQDSIADLVHHVTAIIFTCGPQHAAVNNSQYEYMTFMPNMPLAAYQPIRESANVALEDLVPFLPPRTQAAEQLAILYILAVPYYFDRLGQYEQLIRIPEAAACVLRFQAALEAIEQKIEQRNQTRLVKYPFLKPSQITNSISM